MEKIGFLINPIAGMGGRVGLKGTDDEAYRQAIALGAEPVSELRARSALENLPISVFQDMMFYTCSGKMGEDLLKELGFQYRVAHIIGEETTPEDTTNACKAFLEEKVDIILFCGGDGTARDVAETVGKAVPILGIPAGVKMSSSVFAVTPEAAGELLTIDSPEITDGEILDIDEEEYRMGKLQIKLYALVRTLRAPNKIQDRKNVFISVEEEHVKNEIGRFVLEFMDDETMYILGPGSTVKKICDLMGVKKTLLGVDVLRKGKVIALDANEKKLLELLDNNPSSKAMIIVSPIGSQGFIFGRGNQQISPEVIKKVGVNNILIIATPHKLSQTPVLFTDTGDEELKAAFRGKIRVITGYRMATLREVAAD
jgi:predicted polyphosphate/ATP-dependent NAD kinase